MPLPDPESATGAYPPDEVIDRYLPRFLLWLWDRTAGEPGVPVSCAEFGARQAIPVSTVRVVVERLRGHRMLRTHGGRDGDAVVSFEPAGSEQARWLRARRADPVERGRYARKALLAWIYARSGHGPLRIEEFLDSAEVFFLGEPLTGSEVATTVAYLAESGLVSCDEPVFQGAVGSRVRLTPLGVDAVLSGDDVGRFIEQQRERARPTTGPVFHAPVYGYAAGDLTVHGDVTIQALTTGQLAALIRQLAPVLADEEGTRALLVHTADALGEGGGDGTPPDPDVQQGLLERLRAALQGTPDSAGRQLMLDTVEQTMGSLLG